MQHGDSEMIKSSNLHINDCIALNGHLGMLRTSSSSKPLTSWADTWWEAKCYKEKLKSFHLDVKEGPALNSHLGILQPTSSFKPYILFTETWLEASRQNGKPELLKSFHSDTKDGHSFNSHLGILQTVSSSKPCVLLSVKKATWRLRINKNYFIQISKMARN